MKIIRTICSSWLSIIIRYLPLIIGCVGLVIFISVSVAYDVLPNLPLRLLIGIIISCILIFSGLQHLFISKYQKLFGSILTILYALGIILIGLRPKYSNYQNIHDSFLMFSKAGFYPYDIVLNIIGFIPLAFLAVNTSKHFLMMKRLRQGVCVLLIIFLCSILSITIEVFQYVIEGRASSLVDVIMNTIGAMGGGIFGIFYSSCWDHRLS